MRLEGGPALRQALARVRFSPTPNRLRVLWHEGDFTERLLS
ncbi:hypothetical protein [Archangium violaceum]|nr:hypothetical protein [Archangium violaceum]